MQPQWSALIANANAKALAAQAKKAGAGPGFPPGHPSAHRRLENVRKGKAGKPVATPANFYAGKVTTPASVKYPTQAAMRYTRGKQTALVAQDGLTGTAGKDRLAMYQGTKPQ